MTDYDYTARLSAARRRHTERYVAIQTEWEEDPLTLGHLRALVAAADGMPDGAEVDYTPSHGFTESGVRLAVIHGRSDAECKQCHGAGVAFRPGGNEVCEACGGTGEHIVEAEVVDEDQADDHDPAAAADRAYDAEVDRANGVI